MKKICNYVMHCISHLFNKVRICIEIMYYLIIYWSIDVQQVNLKNFPNKVANTHDIFTNEIL